MTTPTETANPPVATGDLDEAKALDETLEETLEEELLEPSLKPDTPQEAAACMKLEDILRAVESDAPPGAWGLRLGRGEGKLLLVAVSAAALAVVSWAAASQALFSGVGASIISSLSVVLLGALCVFVLQSVRQRSARRRVWLIESLKSLAAGGEVDVKAAGPLAEAFAEAGRTFEERARSQLRDQGRSLNEEFHRDLVGVRAECDRLAEKNAEQAALRKKAEDALEDSEKQKRRASRLFDRLAEEVEGSAQRIAKLVRDLAGAKPSGKPTARKGQSRGKTARKRSQPAVEAAARIELEATQLERLVERFNQASRMETTAVSIAFSELNISRLLKKCFDEVSAQAEEKGLEMSRKIQRSLPRAQTDVGLVTRILRELLANAVAYTPGGRKVHVEVRLDPEDRVAVEVSDTGPGIPAADIERVFRVFERGSKARTASSGPAAGLGLALARSYARLLGGDLTVESKLRKGSTFRLTLPVKPRLNAS